MLTSSHPYAAAWGRSLNKRLTTKSVQLEELSVDLDDYRPLLLKAKSNSIELIALCLNPGQNGLVALQVKELHYQVSLVGCNFLEGNAVPISLFEHRRGLLLQTCL